jgi:hypothetical protein
MGVLRLTPLLTIGLVCSNDILAILLAKTKKKTQIK